MKYVWEESDIKPGRVVCKPMADASEPWEPSGWTAKWTSKIGYMFRSDDKRLMRISLTDGLVVGPYTEAEMVEWLNENGMIPMPHEWLLKTMDYLRGCYE